MDDAKENPQKDDKSNILASTKTSISEIATAFTVFTSVLIASLFLLSCEHLYHVETALGFYATQYLDFIDYFQSVPTFVGTVVGDLAFLFGSSALVVLGMWGFLAILWKHWRQYLWSGLRVALATLLCGFILSVFVAIWYDGATLKDSVRTMKSSTVFRKSEPSKEGALFLHSSRYIFLWKSDDNSVVAIPNVEVQMIQTPSNLLLSRGTPPPVIWQWKPFLRHPRSWLLNVVGLVISTAAAAMMFYFPPRLPMYTEKGAVLGVWEGNPTDKGKRLGKWQARLAKVGPGLLILGFALQLIAAWISRGAS